MKIAVTYENGEVFQHFGHSEHFKIYDVSGGKVASARVVDTEGSGHGALAGFLAERRVDTLLCGGAKAALAEAGIAVYGGVTGPADGAVEVFLQGSLRYDADAACSHHDHEGGHSCGEHACGGDHGCGGHKA